MFAELLDDSLLAEELDDDDSLLTEELEDDSLLSELLLEELDEVSLSADDDDDSLLSELLEDEDASPLGSAGSFTTTVLYPGGSRRIA